MTKVVSFLLMIGGIVLGFLGAGKMFAPESPIFENFKTDHIDSGTIFFLCGLVCYLGFEVRRLKDEARNK